MRPLLIVVLALIGVSTTWADQTVFHNTPPVVESQTGTGCALDNDVTDCVTNTGPCVWDADDTLTTSEYGRLAQGESLTSEACVFADWTAHLVAAYVYAPSRYDLTLYVTLDGRTVTAARTDYGKQSVWRLCTLTADYDRSDPRLEEIPYQGGGGGVLGRAVPTTVTFTLTNEGKRANVALNGVITANGSGEPERYCP